MQVEILAKAIKKNPQIYKFFNSNFYKQFSGVKVTRNEKNLTYHNDDAELTLNIDTALIESFSQNNITVQILKFKT
jgi:pyruvate-formate lyase-activating enzyme